MNNKYTISEKIYLIEDEDKKYIDISKIGIEFNEDIILNLNAVFYLFFLFHLCVWRWKPTVLPRYRGLRRYLYAAFIVIEQ